MGDFRIVLIVLFSVLEASEETFSHFPSSREPSFGPDIHYPCFCSPTKFEPLMIQTPIQSTQIKESNSSRCSNINIPLNDSLTIGTILGSPGSLSTRAISECVVTSRRFITRRCQFQTAKTLLSSRSGLLLAYVHEFAIEDAEGGKAGGGDLDSRFDGCPNGRGDEVPCWWKGQLGVKRGGGAR
jgi:hypothetical protein